MGIEKAKLLVSKSVYWVNINNDIENYIKTALHVSHFNKWNLRKRSYIMTSQ